MTDHLGRFWNDPHGKYFFPPEMKEVYLRVSGTQNIIVGYLGVDGYWHDSTHKERLKSHMVTGWADI